MAIGGNEHEERWGKTQHLKPYPWRNQSWDLFPTLSDVPRPAKAGTGAWNPGGVGAKISLVETGLSLKTGCSVQRNSLRGNKIFFSTRGWQLATVSLPETTPFNIIDPHPTPAPTRIYVRLTRGWCWRSHPDCCQGKQTSPRAQCPRDRVLLVPSASVAFPMEGEESWQSPHAPLSALYWATPTMHDFSWETTPLLSLCH